MQGREADGKEEVELEEQHNILSEMNVYAGEEMLVLMGVTLESLKKILKRIPKV